MADTLVVVSHVEVGEAEVNESVEAAFGRNLPAVVHPRHQVRRESYYHRLQRGCRCHHKLKRLPLHARSASIGTERRSHSTSSLSTLSTPAMKKHFVARGSTVTCGWYKHTSQSTQANVYLKMHLQSPHTLFHIQSSFRRPYQLQHAKLVRSGAAPNMHVYLATPIQNS